MVNKRTYAQVAFVCKLNLNVIGASEHSFNSGVIFLNKYYNLGSDLAESCIAVLAWRELDRDFNTIAHCLASYTTFVSQISWSGGQTHI